MVEQPLHTAYAMLLPTAAKSPAFNLVFLAPFAAPNRLKTHEGRAAMQWPDRTLTEAASRIDGRAQKNARTKRSFSFKTELQKLCPVVLDLANLPRAKSFKRAQVLSRWRQEKCHERNAFVSNGEIKRLS